MESGWDNEDARKEFAEGYLCLACYRTIEKCSSLESLFIAKLSGRANDPTVLESGTKRRANCVNVTKFRDWMIRQLRFFNFKEDHIW